MDDVKVDIRCILKGETAHKFMLIWQKKGLENKTEVIRALINDFYETRNNELQKLEGGMP